MFHVKQHAAGTRFGAEKSAGTTVSGDFGIPTPFER
jgi:hypothetical protein